MASADQLRVALDALGKFKIAKEIGDGMNATAFLASHLLQEHEAFLKVYDYVEEDAAEALREPRLLVQATRDPPRCENIVEVFDTDVLVVADEKFVCLQMEYVDGSNLLRILQLGPMGQQEAVRVGLGILRGVLHLHGRRMVHRDLKPANILLSGNVPKITDFGSVAVIPEAVGHVRASRHSALYVPPEGWAAESTYSFASDIYQVGVVLHELVHGPLKYDQEHYLTKHVTQALPKPFRELDSYDQSKAADRSIAERARRGTLLKVGGARQPYVSERLQKLIRAATQPDPSLRIAGHELLDRLSGINVPNWRPMSPNVYEAKSWQGWDLRLESESRKGKELTVLKRSKVGLGNYRRHGEFSSLLEACRTVERE